MNFRLVIILLFAAQSLSFSQSWQQLQDFPGVERDDAVGFVIGTKAFVGTGLITGWQPSSDFYEFDFPTSSWSQVPSIPAGNERQYAIAFSGNGKGYVFGGVRGSTFLRDLWSFDPGTNQWSLMSSLPDKSRAGCSGFVINDKFYLAGGVDSSNTILDEVWIYNILSNQWTKAMSPMPKGLWRASATEMGGKGYVIFGKDSAGRRSNDLFSYQPANDTWTYDSSFPGSGRTYASLTTVDNKLILFGGLDSVNTSYADLWIYDFTNWDQKTSIPGSPRRGGVIIPYLWDVYYTTGINGQNQRLKDTWRVNSVTGLTEQSDERFALYPNPAVDYIQVKGTIQGSRFEICELLGKVIKNVYLEKDGMIDVSDLPAGVYFLRGDEKVNRFVKVD